MNSGLAIGIPTYNRKEGLLRLLKSIERQEYAKLDEIVIGDNHSNYDVEKVLQENLEPLLFEKCRIIKNNVNIGGPANIKNQFLFCNSKWFWLIGDDDEITNDSIDIILNDIKSDPECAYFKYSTLTKHSVILEDDIKIDNLHSFIDYEKRHNTNNLVFMSDNIYNMEKLAPYLIPMMTYFTEVPQNIPILVGLDKKDVYMRFSSKCVTKFNMPEGGVAWNMLQVMSAISNIQDIPFYSLSRKDIQDLLSVFMLLPFRVVVGWCLRNMEKVGNYHRIRRVYYGMYNKPFSLFNFLLLVLCKLEFQYNIHLLKYIYKKRKS